jgi:hypothetical protein
MKSLLRPFSWFEQHLVFVPESSMRGTPAHAGLEYDDVFPVTAYGVKLHGWHMPGEPISGERSGVVWLIFHGNGGNVSVRLDQYQEIHHRYGASILAIDYRGYGRSEGVPSEAGFYADALAASNLVRELYPGKRIVVFGRSMGGAVASQLTSVVSPTVLLLEAAISSLSEVIR